MKFIGYVFQSFFLLLMIGVAGLFLLPMLPIEHNIELRIVQSGSMEPNIMTGSLVMVQPRDEYRVGDVITFNSRSAKVPTTHRIVDSYVEDGRTMFITKGDANEEADAEPVARGEVKGLVQFAVPRLGYILEFTRQPIGFGLLIVLPAFLIILSEIEKIWIELRRKRGIEQKDEDENGDDLDGFTVDVPSVTITAHSRRMMDIATPVRYLELPTLDLRRFATLGAMARRAESRHTSWRTAAPALLFGVLVLGTGYLGHTLSYLYDSEASAENTLGAISLDFTAAANNQTYDFAKGGIVGSDGAVELTILPEPGSAAMYYDVKTSIAGGDASLCAVLSASSLSPVAYSDPLTSLSITNITFLSPWTLTFSVIDDSALTGGETCDVDLTFTAWYVTSEGEGYSDEEVIPIHFNYLPSVMLRVTSPALLSVSATDITDETGDVVTEGETGDEEEGATTNEEEVGDEEQPEEEGETSIDSEEEERVVEEAGNEEAEEGEVLDPDGRNNEEKEGESEVVADDVAEEGGDEEEVQ